MLYGIEIGIIEVFFIFLIGHKVRQSNFNFCKLNIITYYWLIFTIVTGFFWETAYVLNFEKVANYSSHLYLV